MDGFLPVWWGADLGPVLAAWHIDFQFHPQASSISKNCLGLFVFLPRCKNGSLRSYLSRLSLLLA